MTQLDSSVQRPAMAPRYSRFWPGRIVFISLLLMLPALAPVVSSAVPADPCGARPRRIEAATAGSVLRPHGCSLQGVVVVDQGVGVTIPGPGRGVIATASALDGSDPWLEVRTRLDGSVQITRGQDLTESRAAAPVTRGNVSQGPDPCTNCTTACRDSSFVLGGYIIDTSAGPYEWFFNRSTTPNGGRLSPDKAEAAFKQAESILENSKNNCKMADQVDFDGSYEGDTTSTATMNSSGVCLLPTDGISVVDFGSVGFPALTCAYTTVGAGHDLVIDADVRLQKTASWTTDPKGTACFIDYDLVGIASHEFGHRVGLAHVSVAHGNQSMSLFGLPNCSKAYRTWGKGDVKGLRALY